MIKLGQVQRRSVRPPVTAEALDRSRALSGIRDDALGRREAAVHWPKRAQVEDIPMSWASAVTWCGRIRDLPPPERCGYMSSKSGYPARVV